jgi:hypothetical protein
MKKFFLAAALCAVASSALADGYVGGVRSKGRISYECNSGLDCKKSAELLRLYAGARIDARNQIDLGGVAKIDSFEFGYWRGNKPSASGLAKMMYYDENVDGGNVLPDNPLNNNFVPVRYAIGFDALVASAVARAPLVDDLSAFLKLGLAYVTATKRYDMNGASNKSWTASRFKPYLGLGLDYKIADGLSLTGSFDYSLYEVDGTKGSIKSFGVGAEYAY